MEPFQTKIQHQRRKGRAQQRRSFAFRMSEGSKSAGVQGLRNPIRLEVRVRSRVRWTTHNVPSLVLLSTAILRPSCRKDLFTEGRNGYGCRALFEERTGVVVPPQIL